MKGLSTLGLLINQITVHGQETVKFFIVTHKYMCMHALDSHIQQPDFTSDK